MEKMKRIKKRLSLTLRSSQTIDESLSELAEQMTIEESGTKDNGTNVIYCFFPFFIFKSNLTIKGSIWTHINVNRYNYQQNVKKRQCWRYVRDVSVLF